MVVEEERTEDFQSIVLSLLLRSQLQFPLDAAEQVCCRGALQQWCLGSCVVGHVPELPSLQEMHGSLFVSCIWKHVELCHCITIVTHFLWALAHERTISLSSFFLSFMTSLGAVSD